MLKFIITLILLPVAFASFVCGQNITSSKQVRLMTDREAEGLQDKVKSVFIENADLKFKDGENFEGERRTSSVTEFDENGNRIKRATYSSGKLFQVVSYGILDGEKISKEERIEDGSSPLISVPNPKKQEKPADTRYSYKFKYGYDKNGNRIEEFWVHNSGDIWIHDVIEFDDRRNVTKKIRRHRGEDKISSITLYKYNDKGDLTDEIYADGNGNESEKHSSHEFDSSGNWIKSTVSRKKRDGSFEPFLVTYRKITYFNQK